MLRLVNVRYRSVGMARVEESIQLSKQTGGLSAGCEIRQSGRRVGRESRITHEGPRRERTREGVRCSGGFVDSAGGRHDGEGLANLSVWSLEWRNAAAGSDAIEGDGRGLMRCPQCQKGMGSKVGLNVELVMRAVSRLARLWILTQCVHPPATAHLLAGLAKPSTDPWGRLLGTPMLWTRRLRAGGLVLGEAAPNGVDQRCARQPLSQRSILSMRVELGRRPGVRLTARLCGLAVMIWCELSSAGPRCWAHLTVLQAPEAPCGA